MNNASPSSLSTLQALQAAPYCYGFFQAVRLLRHADRATDHPHTLRFSATQGLGFPATEIAALETRGDTRTLHVNFMGITGPTGVLPVHYTEWLVARAQQRDNGPRDFLDIFNHKLIELFWQAWAHYRPEIAVEQTGQAGIVHHVYDLVGLGTPGLSSRAEQDALPLSAVGYYSGLLSQRPHGAGALEQVIGDWLNVPVRVHPCVGTWQPLHPTQRSRVGRQHAALTTTCQIGSQYWDRQSTVCLHIGPLSRAAFESLLPHAPGDQLQQAASLARFMTDLSTDIHIRLHVAPKDVPVIRLGRHARLGWSSWLGGCRQGRPRSHPAAASTFHLNATGGPSWR